MVSCDQISAVGLDADGFSAVRQSHAGLVADERAAAGEHPVPGMCESHEVVRPDAVGAPVSGAVSGAGCVSPLLSWKNAVAWVPEATRVTVSVRCSEHLEVSVAGGTEDEGVMRQQTQ